MKIYEIVIILLNVAANYFVASEDSESAPSFNIEGKVILSAWDMQSSTDQEWLTSSRILVDGGQYLGFLRSDGTFTISNIPSGSYVVEVTNPNLIFEPARVDITAKGKFRARKVNHVQTSAVSILSYPLKFKPKMKANYFQQREQWRITDFLFNPMVLMMVMPLLLIMVVPKLVNTNDPETQKEMQNQMNMLNPKQQMPDLSEMFTSLLGGGKKPIKSKKDKRK